MAASAAGKRNLKDIGAGLEPDEPATVALTQLAAPAGGGGATAGAYDSAANRDLMIASVNAARDDIIALRAMLVDLGLIA